MSPMDWAHPVPDNTLPDTIAARSAALFSPSTLDLRLL
jgi:hypothetical protein